MLNVIIGLFGLGLVVFLHEMGHLIAAKASGVTVEAFSIGWGKAVWARSYRGTEYRVSVLPLGGYCKMKGEQALVRAWREGASEIEPDQGDFYAATAAKRIAILLAGPVMNFLFAVLVLSIIAMIGYTIETFPPRIVLASEYGAPPSVADEAGLRSGDTITAINGREVTTFREIQSYVGRSPNEAITITVTTEQTSRTLSMVPSLNRRNGAGMIGVYPWITPLVARVEDGSSAQVAGIKAGDTLLEINGEPVAHSPSG